MIHSRPLAGGMEPERRSVSQIVTSYCTYCDVIAYSVRLVKLDVKKKIKRFVAVLHCVYIAK